MLVEGDDVMHCPSCNHVMEKGSIPAYRQRLFWISDETKNVLKIFPMAKKRIGINRFPFLLGRVTTFYCGECGFLLIPSVKDETQDD